MDSLEEDLTCSVCYSLFCDPRVLPCSHTFCRGCLDGVLQRSFSIWRPLRAPLKCPCCRSVVELTPAGLEDLPANVSLRAIVEKFQREARPRPPCCPEHPLQPLNVYCLQDRQLVCGLCLTLGAHQGHAIDDLDAAFVRERAEWAGLAGGAGGGRWAGVCARAEQLQRERGRCEATLQQDRQAVARLFLALERALQGQRLAAMAALDAAEAELEREYGPPLEQLKRMQEEQQELLARSEELAQEEEPLAFLQQAHALRERVDALTNTPLPQVRPLSPAPRAAHLLEQQWAGATLSVLEQSPAPLITCCSDTPRPRPSPALLVVVLALLLSLCLALIGWSGLRQALTDWGQNLWLQPRCLLASLREAAAHCLASITPLLCVW